MGENMKIPKDERKIIKTVKQPQLVIICNGLQNKAGKLAGALKGRRRGRWRSEEEEEEQQQGRQLEVIPSIIKMVIFNIFSGFACHSTLFLTFDMDNSNGFYSIVW